uniref:Uncharacterized protein n=1 Tax=viral metagenome TaxID=1070528 RepID=A0A6C0EGN7_9ZZZZ
MGNVMGGKKTAKRVRVRKSKKGTKKARGKSAKKAPARKSKKGTKRNKRKMKGGFGFRFSPNVVQGASSSALANPMPHASYNNCASK